jgi:hypothetical protein
VSNASVGQACTGPADAPGTFAWFESTPGSNIWFMGCQINPA